MAQPQTILGCFTTPLPPYGYGGKSFKPEKGKSVSQKAEPPVFGILRNQNDRWVARGRAWLASLQGLVNGHIAGQQQLLAAAPQQQAAQINQSIQWAQGLLNNLQVEFISHKENAILHQNEADIVRTAALYLVHPVCQALDACYQYHHTFSTQCEDSPEGTRLRTDITFRRSPRQQGGLMRPFAVLEFKRRSLIRGDDFTKAIRQFIPSAANAPQQITAIKNSIATPAAGHPVTLFSSGTEWLMKQAASYAVTCRTRYVAMFNYDYLICFYFPELDHTQTSGQGVLLNGGAGDYVEIDVYPFYNRQKRDISDQMRPALLGFLQDAYANTPP